MDPVYGDYTGNFNWFTTGYSGWVSFIPGFCDYPVFYANNVVYPNNEEFQYWESGTAFASYRYLSNNYFYQGFIGIDQVTYNGTGSINELTMSDPFHQFHVQGSDVLKGVAVATTEKASY
jgi:hypothetical protein